MTPLHGQHTTIYSGAGISRGAGIADYASKNTKNSLSSTGAPRLANPLEAKPTRAHKVLAAMYKQGLIHEWVNQNHDGLPEKAGIPQSAVNEIHGAWFDPSNPVVQFNESLRTDLFERLLDTEKKTTFCLCLGTSLSGMNADRVAISCAKRFSKKGVGLGTVIINLQQTPLDEHASVRVWARLDDTMECIARHLKLAWEQNPPAEEHPKSFSSVTLIPYDGIGHRLRDGSMRVLDVSADSEVICGWGDRTFSGVVQSVDGEGHVTCVLKRAGKLPRYAVLGRWWIDDAMHGNCDGDRMPLRNVASQTFPPSAPLATIEFSCEFLESKHWRWSIACVSTTPLAVESVELKLHETFNPSLVVVKAGEPLVRTGWGYFAIPMVVRFIDGSSIDYTFDMNFDKATQEIPLPLSMRKVK